MRHWRRTLSRHHRLLPCQRWRHYPTNLGSPTRHLASQYKPLIGWMKCVLNIHTSVMNLTFIILDCSSNNRIWPFPYLGVNPDWICWSILNISAYNQSFSIILPSSLNAFLLNRYIPFWTQHLVVIGAEMSGTSWVVTVTCNGAVCGLLNFIRYRHSPTY